MSLAASLSFDDIHEVEKKTITDGFRKTALNVVIAACRLGYSSRSLSLKDESQSRRCCQWPRLSFTAKRSLKDDSQYRPCRPSPRLSFTAKRSLKDESQCRRCYPWPRCPSPQYRSRTSPRPTWTTRPDFPPQCWNMNYITGNY